MRTGTARGQRDNSIPWILEKDTQTIIQVTETKTPTCISELSCNATQTDGITELTVVEHSLRQQMEDQSALICFHYFTRFVCFHCFTRRLLVNSLCVPGRHCEVLPLCDIAQCQNQQLRAKGASSRLFSQRTSPINNVRGLLLREAYQATAM